MKTAIPALLFLASIANAQEPKAVISGPSNGTPGDIIVLKATESENATGFVWLVETDATIPAKASLDRMRAWAVEMKAAGWNPQEPADPQKPLWLLSEDGKRIQLASYAGTYKVTLAVGNTETDTPSLAAHTFRSIHGGTPVPPPDPPTPPDPPNGDFEDRVADWVSYLPKNSPVRSRLRALGGELEQIGKQAEVLGSVDAVDELVGTVIKFGYRDVLEEIQPFLTSADAAFDSLGEDVTLTVYGAALISIAKGLQNVETE